MNAKVDLPMLFPMALSRRLMRIIISSVVFSSASVDGQLRECECE
jgi:hypothetical protein